MDELNFERGCFSRDPSGGKLRNILELPFRAAFSTVSGRVVERRGKLWRTADVVHVCSHDPVGVGAGDTQYLPLSSFVCAMSRNR